MKKETNLQSPSYPFTHYCRSRAWRLSLAYVWRMHIILPMDRYNECIASVESLLSYWVNHRFFWGNWMNFVEIKINLLSVTVFQI